jgi:hypothetical protein
MSTPALNTDDFSRLILEEKIRRVVRAPAPDCVERAVELLMYAEQRGTISSAERLAYEQRLASALSKAPLN